MIGRPATINDVAAAAGVSRQTVTRAVNAMPGISALTRERVLEAARELHYRPSRFGRGLVKPQTRILGLLIADLSNPYYAELASAVLGLAAEAGWNVILAERAHAAHADEFLIDEFSRQVDAVISFTGIGIATSRDGLPDLPLVEIDPLAPIDHLSDPTAQLSDPTAHGRVDLDRCGAVTQAAQHLQERGVTHPVVFDRAEPSPRAMEFVRAFADLGLTAPRISCETTDLEGGLENTLITLRDRPDTDAIVAHNDVMGFGVLRALRLAGIDVPGRIKVIGVDGLGIGRFITPRLTTLAIDMPLVARTALDLVLAMHGGELPAGEEQTRRTVPYRLDIGEST